LISLPSLIFAIFILAIIGYVIPGKQGSELLAAAVISFAVSIASFLIAAAIRRG
jgi:hypothetical protein